MEEQQKNGYPFLCADHTIGKSLKFICLIQLINERISGLNPHNRYHGHMYARN